MKAKAKVDTGIKKRSGGSAKEFRRSSSKPAKALTIKELNLRDNSNTEVLRDKKEISLHDILNEDNNLNNKL